MLKWTHHITIRKEHLYHISDRQSWCHISCDVKISRYMVARCLTLWWKEVWLKWWFYNEWPSRPVVTYQVQMYSLDTIIYIYIHIYYTKMHSRELLALVKDWNCAYVKLNSRVYDSAVMVCNNNWIMKYINSSYPSDSLRRHKSVLVQVMACDLTAPSHYLKQCWHINNAVIWLKTNFTTSAQNINSLVLKLPR